MDLRTHDRLTTAADVAPWLVAVVALLGIVLPLVRERWPGESAAPQSAAIVIAGPITTAPIPLVPGQTLPEGFEQVDDNAVQVDQKVLSGRAATVAVVGDSLTVGASPGLRRLLTDVNLRIDAKVGRSMPDGVRAATAIKASTAGIVVIALGSNDSCDLTECTRRVKAVLAAVNPSAPVVWMLPARFRPGMGYVRTAVQEALASRPRSVVLDWQPYQDAHPEIVQGDGIHLTAAGYRLRAEVTAAQVHSLLVR